MNVMTESGASSLKDKLSELLPIVQADQQSLSGLFHWSVTGCTRFLNSLIFLDQMASFVGPDVSAVMITVLDCDHNVPNLILAGDQCCTL